MGRESGANSPITKKFSGCTKNYSKTGFPQFRCPLHPPQADGFAAAPIRAKFGFGAFFPLPQIIGCTKNYFLLDGEGNKSLL